MTKFIKLRRKSRKREKQRTIYTYFSTPAAAEYFTLINELNKCGYSNMSSKISHFRSSNQLVPLGFCLKLFHYISGFREKFYVASSHRFLNSE